MSSNRLQDPHMHMQIQTVCQMRSIRMSLPDCGRGSFASRSGCFEKSLTLRTISLLGDQSGGEEAVGW